MGTRSPSRMQSLIFARICIRREMGMSPLTLLTKVMYLTLESLFRLVGERYSLQRCTCCVSSVMCAMRVMDGPGVSRTAA